MLPQLTDSYGGGFFGGGASYYSAFEVAVQQYARQRNQPVIHVAMNYRLGIWGWGLGKEFKAAGLANNGIRDQKVALQWVKENIANFGGDPNKITLYGESAGAISTAIHLLDQRNEGLFHGAIMQSGSASTLPSPRTEEYQGPYDDIVAAAGCSGAADTFDCLKGKSQDQLASAQLQVNLMSKYTMGIVAITWRPSVDGDIIPDFPSKLLSAGKFAPIPWISGTNKDE